MQFCFGKPWSSTCNSEDAQRMLTYTIVSACQDDLVPKYKNDEPLIEYIDLATITPEGQSIQILNKFKIDLSTLPSKHVQWIEETASFNKNA